MSAVDEFCSLIRSAADSESLIGLTLAKPAAGSFRTTVRPIRIGDQTRYQWSWQDGPRCLHENLTADEFGERLSDVVGSTFLHVHAFTVERDISLLISKKGKATLQKKRPSKSLEVLGHDRSREYLICEGTPCPFLEAAGVMLPDGRVPKAKRSKFRQINRFLELVNDIYPELPPDCPLNVVEFGSGKSHLTFAIHHLLAVHHEREVRMRSIDRNASVVTSSAEVTKRLGLSGISHEASDIAEITLERPIHLALWLHACDTATDDALAKSVEAGADVILAVPCCQHEVLHLMESDSLLDQYGLLKERHAALATDALRAAALEILGYRVQVVEFIDLEHTAKNVLLRAVRRKDPVDATPWKDRYQQLKSDLGLETWTLERDLDVLKPDQELETH